MERFNILDQDSNVLFSGTNYDATLVYCYLLNNKWLDEMTDSEYSKAESLCKSIDLEDVKSVYIQRVISVNTKYKLNDNDNETVKQKDSELHTPRSDSDHT